MSTIITKPTPPAEIVPPATPPLQAGDHLSRDEFERRYEQMRDVKKAELIEGVVYMPSPVRFRHHSQPHFDLITWLGFYAAFTRGTGRGDNGTIRLDLDNEPQPDAFLMLLPEFGGQARIDEDDYIEGAPELVAEVAASTVSYDLHNKLRAYRRNGVREYVVWRVDDQAVDWFELEAGEYRLLVQDEAGVSRSRCFPGLWLDVPALLAGRLAQVFETVQRGVATPEHATFVESLAQQRTSP